MLPSPFTLPECLVRSSMPDGVFKEAITQKPAYARCDENNQVRLQLSFFAHGWQKKADITLLGSRGGLSQSNLFAKSFKRIKAHEAFRAR